MENKVVWKEVVGVGFWKPIAAGETLEGTVVDSKTGNFGRQLIIVDSAGLKWSTPSHKILQARLTDVNVGDRVKIEFLAVADKVKPGQKPAMIYKVSVAEK